MLEVQKYLSAGKTIDDLVEEFKLEIARHPSLPLVILNYSQTESKPKSHPIIRECRNLIINTSGFLVSKSFSRFFNLGEEPEITGKFNWENFSCLEKVDGSLINLFYYDRQWKGTTRGSWGLQNMGEFIPYTWRDMMLMGMGLDSWDSLNGHLDPNLSYICELCSPYNQVIKYHEKPKIYLLTCFRGENEVSWKELEGIKEKTSHLFVFPAKYGFHSMENVLSYVNNLTDPTDEGLVCCDGNLRVKVKNKDYVALAALKGNGVFINHPKYLIQYVLKGNDNEVEIYFPHVTPFLNEVREKLKDAEEKLLKLFDDYGHLEKKEFALAIKDKHPLYTFCFTMKQGKSIKQIFNENQDYLFKRLFKWT